MKLVGKVSILYNIFYAFIGLFFVVLYYEQPLNSIFAMCRSSDGLRNTSLCKGGPLLAHQKSHIQIEIREKPTAPAVDSGNLGIDHFGIDRFSIIILV